ncbi:MAG: hypothetical protein JWM16_1752 [Verrucomicrobiales bacterium]|nr:hypothetical protein [Verrucomicrobiales bacterium]
MLWSAFLAQHYDEPTKGQTLRIVLLAAALHDTHRSGNSEDETHGQLAAEKFRNEIAASLNDFQSASACLNAIHYHCIPDDKCPNPDIAFQILKDADALDRGRFGVPNRDNGCNTALFRTEVLRSQDSYKNIAWMAYYAAQITRFSLAGATPCSAFSNALCDSVNSLAEDRPAT